MPKVLLVEPDNITARHYKQHLESLGHVVDACSDAQFAILAADSSRPDIVILEIMLASHSGIEFLYEFRSYGEWRSIPVIVVSRLTQASIGLNDKSVSDLNIAKVLYKPDTSLAKLADEIDRQLTTTKHQGKS